MTLKDVMKQDVDIFLNLDENGDDVQYNGQEITAVVDVEESFENGNIHTNNGQTARATAFISVEDVPKPTQGDTLVHQETTWTLARVVSSDSALHQIEFISDERVMW